MVDTLKADLNKCGIRLQEARQVGAITPFASAAGSFTCTYGLADEHLLDNAVKGQQSLKIVANEFFKPSKAILIYNLASQAWETTDQVQAG